MATANNKLTTLTTDGHHSRTADEEPLRKRARLADQPESNEVCIDLKRLMSYNGGITEPITSSNSMPSQTEDAGDSGFQDFTSNDSPLSQKNANEENSEERPTPKTTFASDNQFASIHLNNGFHQPEQNNSQTNQNREAAQHDPVAADPGEEDDSESVISDLSDISCLSDLSDLEDAEKWQSNFGPVSWVQQQITSGMNPRSIIDDLIPNNLIPSRVDNVTLWKFIVNILSEPPRREKLSHVNNLEDVVGLIKNSKKIVVLTGAGISVSSGIPDFRSRDGIYARLSVDFPDLPDPQAMFDINYFRKDQRPFFKFAKEIYPGQFKPSISHKFIKLIESQGKLLRNYTQNIDTLEKSVNIERVITCHGSFSTASCTNCKYRVDGSVIKDDIFAQRIPRCPKCPPDGEALCVMKPDIVFFHESLPDDFHNAMAEDKDECDLLIVIGSSLKVKPVALIPTSIPANVPQILINREHLSHMTFDVELMGDCDIIIQELCHRLGDEWNEICVNPRLNELKEHEFQALCDRKLNAVRNGLAPLASGEPSNSDNLQAIDNSSDLSQSTSNGSVDEKLNLTDILPDDSFVCIKPASYLFKGAELDESSDSSDEDDCDSDEDEEDGMKFANGGGYGDSLKAANRVQPETYSQDSNQMADSLPEPNRIEFDETAGKANALNGHSFPIDTNNNS